MTWTSPGARLAVLALAPVLVAFATGCDPAPDPDPRWLEFGHLGHEHFPDGFAVDPLPFDPLEDGEEVDMISGGQGTDMLAISLRAGGFEFDIANEEWPILDMNTDVEGHNDGFGGHFSRIANWPVWFDETEDGDYEFFWVTVVIPNTAPLSELEGLPGHIEATLEPVGEEPFSTEVDFVIGAAP